MDAGSIVSAATGKATYVGTIGYDYDYLDTSDSSEHSVTHQAGDLFGRALAFDKDASHLAVGFNDKSSPDNIAKPGAVHLYTLTADLASATLVATVGDGYTGGKNVNLSDYMDIKDIFGTGVALNETGSRLVMSSMLADGSGNSKANSGEVMFVKFSDSKSDFSDGEYSGIVGSGYTGAGGILEDIDPQLDSNDQFGRGISLDRDGNRMAVTSTRDDGDGTHTDAGAVYLFTFDNTNFSNPTLTGRIGRGYTGANDLDLGANYANSGRAWRVALDGDGDRLAFSQYQVTYGGVDSGAVYLITFTDSNGNSSTDFENPAHVGTISKIGSGSSKSSDLSISNLGAGDIFTAVALTDDGSRLVVGAQKDDGNGDNNTDTGAVYLITFTDSNGNASTDFENPAHVGTIGVGYDDNTREDYDITAYLDDNDQFGGHLGLTKDGKILAVGAQNDDGFGNGVDNGGAVGALLGGMLAHQNSDATGGTKRVCKIETRYNESSAQVYSHSVVTFFSNGKQYSLRFNK